MNTTNVAIINGITLQVVANEREQLVAVKPVCEVLGVNYTTQVEKLKAHPIFGSTVPLRGIELNKALALTFEEWQADRSQLTIPGFE